ESGTGTWLSGSLLPICQPGASEAGCMVCFVDCGGVLGVSLERLFLISSHSTMVPYELLQLLHAQLQGHSLRFFFLDGLITLYRNFQRCDEVLPFHRLVNEVRCPSA